MPLRDEDRRVLVAFLEFLSSCRNDAVTPDDVTVGMDVITTAFGLTPDDMTRLSIAPRSARDVLTAGLEAPMPFEGTELFQRFLKSVTDRGFFAGVEPGTDAYKARYAKVLKKFQDRLDAQAAAAGGAGAPGASGGAAGSAAPPPSAATGDAAPAPPAAATATAPPAPPAASAATGDDDAAAVAHKDKGNDLLKAGDLDGAIAEYSEALRLSPSGPYSHIFHCNRCAAYTTAGDFDAALHDARSAVTLKPSYAKAHSRLGTALFKLNRYNEAVEAYEEALRLDPSMTSTADSLRQAKQAAGTSTTGSSAPSASAPASASSAPPAPPTGGGGGGLGGLATMMQNPDFMNMAQQVMSNPAMMSMAQNMMQNPATLEMLGKLGGGGGGGDAGGGGMPDLSALMGALGGGGTGGEGSGGTPDLSSLMSAFGGGGGGTASHDTSADASADRES